MAFRECYHSVGDLAETIAHILPPPTRSSDFGLADWMEERIAPLRGADPEVIRAALFAAWDELDWQGRFLLAKLIGGGFRVGVSRLLVTRALAAVAQLDRSWWRSAWWAGPTAAPARRRALAQLIAPPRARSIACRAASPIPSSWRIPCWSARATGPAHGLAGGMEIRRHPRPAGAPARQNWLWSRGEELITDRFPELAALALPDGTVIDGEIVIRLPDSGAGRTRALRRPAETHRPQDAHGTAAGRSPGRPDRL
jgi:DNA ligase-1